MAAGLASREKERPVLAEHEERSNLPSLSTGQSREVSIDIVGKLRFEAGDRQTHSARKEHIRRRPNIRGLTSVKNAESLARRGVARDESLEHNPNHSDEEHDEEEFEDHDEENNRVLPQRTHTATSAPIRAADP